MSEASASRSAGQRHYTPMTIAELAQELAAVGDDESVPWRLVREFLVEFCHEEPLTQAVLLRDMPHPTGSRRWDAFLAAIAEHLSFHHRLPCPAWTQEPDRSLPSAWFLTDLPAARAAAMETSPASFRRRLIFLDRSDLDVA